MVAKKAVVAKKVEKKAPVKKATKAKIKAGDKFKCQACGLVVSVDEACGCVETCDIICCDTPMKKKR